MDKDIEKNEFFSKESLEFFFYDFNLKNPAMIFFYMVITLGLYFVTWLYQVNKKLEEIDEKAPVANRAALVLVLLPLIWFFVIYFIEMFTGNSFNFFNNLISNLVKVLGWGLISFLSLMYIYDFCISFGKVTKTPGIMWYLIIYPGYFSLILTIILGFQYFVFTFYFLIFPILAIPAMQETLNIKAATYTQDSRRTYFNYIQRKH